MDICPGAGEESTDTLHVSSEKIHIKVTRFRILKFTLIFSSHIHVERGSRKAQVRFLQGGLQRPALSKGKTIKALQESCDLQHRAGPMLQWQLIFHVRPLFCLNTPSQLIVSMPLGN